MIVYHGSDAIVKTPDLLHSAKRLDLALDFM